MFRVQLLYIDRPASSSDLRVAEHKLTTTMGFFLKKSSNDDDEISRRFTERREMQGVNQKSADNAGITLGQIGRARCKSPYWHVTESSKNTADERIKE